MRFGFACLLLICACSSKDEPLVIEVTVGYESEAFRFPPPVVSLDIAALDPQGGLLASAATAPGGTFSLGEFSLDQALRIEVHGRDAGNTERMTGKSLTAVAGSFQSFFWPVFVQRVGEFARPPGELTHSYVDGLGGVIGERFLFATGGTGAEPGVVAFYDLLALGGSTGGTLARVPRSLVVSADGNAILVIDDFGATWIDMSANTIITDVELPAGLTSFADVAGGTTIVGPDASYVVGPTRTDATSKSVLVVNADRSLAAATVIERMGAAATWIDEVGGVVIAGGGDDVEVVPSTGTPHGLGFGTDAVIGAGAVAGLVPAQVVLLCGLEGTTPAPARSLDLRCASGCAAEPLKFTLPALKRCSVYNTGSGVLVAVGSDIDTGETRAFAVAPGNNNEVREIVLKEPRRGAVPVPAPNGTLFLLGGTLMSGGDALTVESLMP